jgi:hypothetical protein
MYFPDASVLDVRIRPLRNHCAAAAVKTRRASSLRRSRLHEVAEVANTAGEPVELHDEQRIGLTALQHTLRQI